MRKSVYDRGIAVCRKIVSESATLRGFDAGMGGDELYHYLYAAWIKGYEMGWRKGRRVRGGEDKR